MAKIAFGKEVDFGKDSFGKPKAHSYADSIAKLLLNICMMRPGNIPSAPYIGINIQDYLYQLDSELDVNELKDKIYTQCNQMLPYLISDDLKVFIQEDKSTQRAILVIYFPITIPEDVKATDNGVLLAFTQSDNGGVESEYLFKSLRN